MFFNYETYYLENQDVKQLFFSAFLHSCLSLLSFSRLARLNTNDIISESRSKQAGVLVGKSTKA